MKKILLAMILCLAGGLIIFQGVAAAQPNTPTDVPAGTIITAEGYDVYINYKDTALNPKAPIYGTTLEATVLPIYGLSGPGTPADQYTEPSVGVYYQYLIYNEGNDSDVIKLNLGTASYNGSYGDAWTFEIIRDDDQNGIADDTDTVTDEVLLSEDGNAYFFVKVTPSANAGDGSSGTVQVTASSESTPAGEYIGANANIYGGPQYVTDESTTYLNAPVMTFTKTATVDAPGTYISGGDHDAVPGAVITYTNTYSNEGNADASSLLIKEEIPIFGTTEAAHVNITDTIGAGNIDNVTISAPQSTAYTYTSAKWTAYYSTFESPSPSDYSGAGATHGDWVLLGILAGNGVFYHDPTLPRTTTRWIKFENTTVEAGEYGTLTWGVVIR